MTARNQSGSGSERGDGRAEPSIAVLIPCYNEAQTVGGVVRGFARELPMARIVVGDNNSDDGTGDEAERSGAEVIFVPRQGKGAVIRELFRAVDADIYVMVDGDLTYPASEVHTLLEPVLAGRADMAVGDRISEGHYTRENKRPLHSFGNNLVVGLINLLFRCNLRDIMSGYRVMTRRFVKNCPVLVNGFTLETTMTLHALDKLFQIEEVPITYRDRPAGSESKLSTLKDGFLVLRAILWIFKDNKPLYFFLGLAGLTVFVGVALLLATPPATSWLAGAAFLASLLLLVCGFVLDTMVKLQRESFEVNLMQNLSSDPRSAS